MQSPLSFWERGRGRFDTEEGKLALKQNATLQALKMKESGKGTETDSLLEPLVGTLPCWHVDMAPGNQFQTSDLQKCKRIDVLFQPPNMW